MRITAMFAVVLTTALLGMTGTGSSASALDIATPKQTDFVNKVLLATADETIEKESKKTDAAEVTSTDVTPPETEEPTAPQPVIVTVQRGDTLSSIAARHATTWVRIYNANEAVSDPNSINPGQQLRIPEANEQLTDRALPQPKLVTTKVAASATARKTTAAASYPVSPNAAKAFIYARESGNNPNATNPNGCYGLGQDCNGRVRALCAADYACQDAYFTRYAMARYGSWEGAYAFWMAHHWW